MTGLLASALLISAQPATFRLANGLKPEDALQYAVRVKVEDEIHSVEYTSTLTYKVVELKPNGDISLLSEQTGIKMRHFENEITANDPPATFITYDAQGYVQSISGEDIDGEDYRFQVLNALVWPKQEVGVGSRWSAVLAADSSLGTRAGTAEYEVAARETLLGKDTLKLRYTIRETEGSEPARSEGSMWIDIATGAKVKVLSKMVNAPLAERAVRAEYELTLKV
jgi:hypothetical protein